MNIDNNYIRIELFSDLDGYITETFSRLNIEKIVDENLRSEIKKIALPVCYPRPVNFEPANYDHRISDQVGSGFPFTSKKHPWPQDANGNPKQLIAQVNLAQASDLLGYELGGGLLQLWVSPDVLLEDVELIKIDLSDLQDDLDLTLPKSQFWSNDFSNWDHDFTRIPPWKWDKFYCRFDPLISSPLVKWELVGYQLPNELNAIERIENFPIIEKNLEFIKYLSGAQIEKLGQKNCLDFRLQRVPILGGYTIDWCSMGPYHLGIDRPDTFDDLSEGARLLFSVQWDNGMGVSGACMKFFQNESGEIDFGHAFFDRFER